MQGRLRLIRKVVGFKIGSEITIKTREIGRGTTLRLQLPQLHVAEEKVLRAPMAHTAPRAQENEVSTPRLPRAGLKPQCWLLPRRARLCANTAT